MRLYKQGKLARLNAHLVEKHLLACSLCAEAFDSLDMRRMAEVDKVASRVNKRLATYMNTPPRLGFFQRFGFAVTTAGLLLIGGGGVAWWLNSSENRQADSVDRQAPLAAIAGTSTPAMPVYNAATTRRPETSPVAAAPQNNPSENLQPPAIAANAKKNTAGQKPGAEARKPDAQPAPVVSNNPAGTPVSTPPVQTPIPNNNNNTAQVTPPGDNTRTPGNQPLEVVSARLTMKLSANGNDDGPASGNISNGQFTRKNKPKKHEQTLAEMPQFPGGDWNINEFVMERFKPLKIDRNTVKNNTAMAIVTVSSKGEITKVEIMRGINKEVDAEIARVLQAMPRWQSGKGDIDATVMVTVE